MKVIGATLTARGRKVVHFVSGSPETKRGVLSAERAVSTGLSSPDYWGTHPFGSARDDSGKFTIVINMVEIA